MNLPESSILDTRHLQRLFDNMSESYKIFWFRAIVDRVAAGEKYITFDDIIDDMILDAWYMVTEYKLNLGPADTLESLVLYAQNISGLKSNEKKDIVLSRIRSLNNSEILKKKKTLTLNVPYRLQAPFLDGIKGNAWDIRKESLISKINDHQGLIYRFEKNSGLDSVIVVEDKWADYIKQNYEIILGWIQYNLIVYLQRRNPSVPGISSKLYPPQERKLTEVIKFWKMIIEIQPVYEIYGSNVMSKSDISIDHFVPWSYIANDELWNLSPTTKSINSKKSNHLPEWNTYFPALQALEYNAYQLVWSNDKVHDVFNKCAREHVNNADVQYRLYRQNLTKEEFYSGLEEIIRPVYDAAHNMGFDSWRLQ